MIVAYYISTSVPPEGVAKLTGTLVAPKVIKASWKPPSSGGNIESYKVSYWIGPDSIKTLEVPRDVSF